VRRRGAHLSCTNRSTSRPAVSTGGTWDGRRGAAQTNRLLAEIRDLQQAHFERYKEFTGRLMESDQSNQQFLADQLAYQDELRSYLRNSQKIAALSSIGTVVATGLAAFAAFAALSASRMLP
jgi:hypothetical protein